MSNKITIKRSAVPGKVPVPGDLEYGEFAINYADGNLFFKDSSNSISTLASTQFVSVTGNVTAVGNIAGNYFIGNGALLTGLQTGILSSTVDNFVGDGSTVAFTLSVTPASENLTSVNITGVSQLRTAYSVTGNVMTFTSAPPNGSAIEVTTLSGSATSVANIANGSSSIDIPTLNGNIELSVNGVANVAVVSSSGMQITGDLSVTGNATLSGNILGDRIQNGTTQIDIQTQNGNANVTVGGVANVAVFSTNGLDITGVLNSTGNASVANIAAGAAVFSGAISGSSLSVSTGSVTLGNIVNSNSNGVGNIGSAVTAFNTVFAKATSAQYADLAEIYASDSKYPAGTVVVFGGDQEITVSTEYAQPSVAGVVSTNPAYLMNSAADGQPVALQGRVPCRVVGNISKGDLLTSSTIPGVATTLDPVDWQPGVVIGKALANYNSNTEGVIEAVVGRV